MGKQTVRLEGPVVILGSAAAVGRKEAEGPLRERFDRVFQDSYCGQASWEKAESFLQKTAVGLACGKAGIEPEGLDCVFAGDLLNQCIASAYAQRGLDVPFFGLYGACSTMAESLALAAMTVDGGFARHCAAVTSSHFCSAERQFRTPLEYGGQRSPTAQWTATAAGCCVLARHGEGPRVTHLTWGEVFDAGVTDMSNMGGAMAPAAYKTLWQHFADTGRTPRDYDLILTGDLGALGAEVLTEFFARDGMDLAGRYDDCGLLLFSRETQDVHAGGSGCGCSAAVLCGHILRGMREGRWKRVLFAATGALMSPTACMQGESIPAICHAAAITTEEE